MKNQKQQFKTSWYINILNEQGEEDYIMVKDTEGNINKQYYNLILEISKNIKIKAAKIIAEHRQLDIDIF